MCPTASDFNFSEMPLEERTILAHQLLESVQEEAASCLLSAEQREELERRISEYDAGRVRAISLDELQENLRKRRQNASQD